MGKTKLAVKTEEFDDELVYKVLSLSIGDLNLRTPHKACNHLNPVSDINEIYKEFSFDKLSRIVKDERFERDVNRDIAADSVKGKMDIFLQNYVDIKPPQEKLMDALADIQYSHGDVVVTPIWSKITRETTGDKLKDRVIGLNDAFIDVVETLNNKTVVGVIPSRMPRDYLGSVLDSFHDRGVTSYVIDFDGRSIDTNPSWIIELMRKIKGMGIMEECMLYSANAYSGKFMRNANEVLAKDFMSYGFGIDVLGMNHIIRMGSDGWSKLKEGRAANTFRRFDRDNYSYVKCGINDVCSFRSERKLAPRDQMKAYNLEKQHNETKILQHILSEESTLETYIKTKPLVEKEYVDKIKRVRREALRKKSSISTGWFS